MTTHREHRMTTDEVWDEVDKLRAENEALRASLKKAVHAHGGTHGEDCHAYGANDEEVEPDGDGESADPWCDCGALKIRNDARALLAGQSEGDPR